MRRNPLQTLTKRQMELLAYSEGISVAELKRRFSRLVEKAAPAKKPAKRKSSKSRSKVAANPRRRHNPGHSLMSRAAASVRAGRHDTMAEAMKALSGKSRR